MGKNVDNYVDKMWIFVFFRKNVLQIIKMKRIT